MGVIHKSLIVASLMIMVGCQPRWVNSASYLFANNAHLVQNESLEILSYPGASSTGKFQQDLAMGDRGTLLTHLVFFSPKDGQLQRYQLVSTSSPSYAANFTDGLMEVYEGVLGLYPNERISLPAGPLYHPVMAYQYPLVLDAIWKLKVGEEHLLSMVQPPKGNISVASYYLAQKAAKKRIYLYRNDSNVGTLTYQEKQGRWILQKVDLLNQDVPYIWERIEQP